jgi:hypothetical protein
MDLSFNLNLSSGIIFLLLLAPDRDENKKNLYNNNNTHIADRWDLKA